MDRIIDFVANDLVTSLFLNKLQDRTYSVMRAPGSLEIAGMTRISRAVINQYAGAGNMVPAGSYKAIDPTAGGFDWRAAYVEGIIATIGSSTDRIGGASEQYVNTYLRSSRRFMGFLGTGSSSSFDRATGDYYIEADRDGASNNFNLYADPANGELRLWNITGNDRGVIVVVSCFGKKP